MAAVQQYGKALKHVPDEMKTGEICLAAVKQNVMALKYVPEAMKTPQIREAAKHSA